MRPRVALADCNRNGSRPAISAFAGPHSPASITLLRTTLCATETAISGTGLQSAAPGPHYLHLNRYLTLDQADLPMVSDCLGRVYPHGHIVGETVSVSQ